MGSETVKYRVTQEVTVEIEINDPDVIERVTGPKGDEWRAQLYDLHTSGDVLEHLTYNCLANRCQNAALLDGWGDLPAEAVQMQVVEVYGPTGIEAVEADV